MFSLFLEHEILIEKDIVTVYDVHYSCVSSMFWNGPRLSSWRNIFIIYHHAVTQTHTWLIVMVINSSDGITFLSSERMEVANMRLK